MDINANDESFSDFLCQPFLLIKLTRSNEGLSVYKFFRERYRKWSLTAPLYQLCPVSNAQFEGEKHTRETTLLH